ncbi:MAG TPA: glycerol-3-phosphate dehydrogenase/oxidase, partial [Acidimicrobiia bacterium]|nr:glycerol-3-phosphate dehydrogenase/oxidase [Acidimicrobiia bacterium]
GLVDRRVARLLGTAMWLYDLTGGLRIRRRHHRISKEAALAHIPTLRASNLAGAYVFYDAQTDDARLTLTVARTAARAGAVVANYARVAELRKDGDGRVSGARVVADGHEVEVRAGCVVNAAGVWADDVRALDEGTHPSSIRPAKGVHVTLPWSKVRNDIAAVIPVRHDRRSVFVVPWGDFTYVGTTDTDYDGPLDDPRCDAGDVAYLLGALNGVLAEPVSEHDVVGTWAGLRPLLRTASNARTADLSRRHGVRVSESGVVTITGGKLTTYRRMAADTVDEVQRRLGLRPTRSPTKHLPLLGAEGFTPEPASQEPSLHEHLAGRYGTEAAAVLGLVASDPGLGDPLVPGLPYVRAEAVHAARHEMARTLDDVLARRTRARLLARDASAAAAPAVARLVATELGWDDAEIERQVASYRALVDAEREAALEPAPAPA